MELDKDQKICLEILKKLIETSTIDQGGHELVSLAVDMTLNMIIELKVKGDKINTRFKDSLT